MENLFLEEIPKNAEEEISLLFNLGVRTEELEYLIKIKIQENLHSNSS